MSLAASYLGTCLGGIASGGLGHWDEVVGIGMAAGEHLNGAEVHVAQKAGRKTGCMGHDAFPYYMLHQALSSHP